MYTIIGGDGREYGPVSAAQVRAWMATGRANLQTRVRAQGSEEWRTIADFPEVTGHAGADPADPAAGLEQHLDVFSCYERSWALLKSHFWAFVGATLVLVAMLGGTYLLGYSLRIAANLVVLLPFTAGLYYFFLRHVRGEQAGFGDLFKGFGSAFPTLFVMGIVQNAILFVALCCLILPGIYLGVAYTFAPLVVIDKGQSFWESLEKSRRVATRSWWRLLGLLLLGIPFNLLGVACLGIGVLVTLPLCLGACVYAYEDLFGRPSGRG
ncbi:MAG TPA: DUF4339 domain-containing protein [Opitutaceae bacterium]|jgi:hypothetical protein